MFFKHLQVRLASVILAAVLAGAAQAATPAGCPSPTPATNEVLAERWVELVLNEGDTAGVLAEDYIHNSGYARPVLEGQEAFNQYRKNFFTGVTFTDHEATVDQVIATNDRAVVSWTVDAVYQEGQGGTVAPGTPVTWTGMTIIRPECGRVAEAWVEADNVARLQQIGAISPETP